MGAQAARGPIFPTTCARCGGRLSEPVSFCPHCGAHARLAFGERAPTKKPDVATASPTASAAGAHADVPLCDLLWPSRPTPLFASADADPYGGVRSPSPSLGGARRWGVKTGTALTLVACVVPYSAVVLLHLHDDSAEREQQAASSTVQGSVVRANGTSLAKQAPTTAEAPTIAQGSRTTQSPSAAQSPAMVQSSTMTAGAPPATVASSPAPATTTLSAASGQPTPPAASDRVTRERRDAAASVAMSKPAPPPTATPQPSQSLSSHSQRERASSPSSIGSGKRDGDKNRRLMTLALARARSGLEKNDLHMARSAIDWALSLQHDNSEALMLKQELLSRERVRNAPFNATRGSVKAASPIDDTPQPDVPMDQ